MSLTSSSSSSSSNSAIHPQSAVCVCGSSEQYRTLPLSPDNVHHRPTAQAPDEIDIRRKFQLLALNGHKKQGDVRATEGCGQDDEPMLVQFGLQPPEVPYFLSSALVDGH